MSERERERERERRGSRICLQHRDAQAMSTKNIFFENCAGMWATKKNQTIWTAALRAMNVLDASGIENSPSAAGSQDEPAGMRHARPRHAKTHALNTCTSMEGITVDGSGTISRKLGTSVSFPLSLFLLAGFCLAKAPPLCFSASSRQKGRALFSAGARKAHRQRTAPHPTSPRSERS